MKKETNSVTTIIQVDSFADRPFTGNPAAVCVAAAPLDAAWMQSVASEMNLAETAFLHPADTASGGASDWHLRWFTPRAEVDLCGHATLASAHVLWSEGHVENGAPLRFRTRSGPLGATRDGEWIELDFPATPVEPITGPSGRSEHARAAAVVASLGVEPVFVGRTRFDWFVELSDAEAVRATRPALTRLADLTERGVIVTAPGDDHAVISRFFAPRLGIPEDPVTGSAHCALGPYWAPRLGRDAFEAFQASERGGVVRVRVEGDRVHLGGRAITTLRGSLLV